MTRTKRLASVCAVILASTVVVAGENGGKVTDAELLDSAKRALVPLERSSAAALKQRACFTCHHGSFPVTAIHEAWRHGVTINEENLEKQLERTLDRLQANVDRYRKDPEQQGDINGETDAVGHGLWILDLAGYPADDITQGTADILLDQQDEEGYWEPALQRPPTVGSYFTSTYVALRGVNRYVPPDKREIVKERNARALKWLKTVEPFDTEDMVYRLRSLALLEPGGETFKAQVKMLLDAQYEDDGGWPQVEDRRRDAYATGTVLATLRDTGAVPVSHPAYQAGLRYLLTTQDRTGAWHVRNRTAPVQPFFGSGFPFERDQFISISGTSWAVTALLSSLLDSAGEGQAADSAALPPSYGFGETSRRAKGSAVLRDSSAARGGTTFVSKHPELTRDRAAEEKRATVDEIAFFREKIEPVLKEQCYQCHSKDAEKLKADLLLDTAAGVLRGGENGPILDRLYPERSLLLRSLVEDEHLSLMPPKKPLPAEIVGHFREWVRMGAPDPRH